MATCITILLVLFCGMSAFGQDMREVVSSQELIDVINWKIWDDDLDVILGDIERVNRNVVPWVGYDTMLLIPDTTSHRTKFLRRKALDSIFTSEDFEYVKKQLQSYIGRKHKWTNGDLLGVKIINVKPLDKMKRGDDYHEYSLPLFSKDHSLCIFKFNYVCGLLCESWRMALFKKTKDGWKQVVILFGMES
ncbi:MAG: hypothetical protein IPM69_07215 [Ignavibacteria bacterium]|nr:hypothetical protein [Ignavibacteria bacterium]